VQLAWAGVGVTNNGRTRLVVAIGILENSIQQDVRDHSCIVPRSRCASTKCSHCSYSSFFPPSCNWRARAYWSKKLGEFELSESASSES
jgi:hypothetical protein